MDTPDRNRLLKSLSIALLMAMPPLASADYSGNPGNGNNGGGQSTPSSRRTKQVEIPDTDLFAPFALTLRAGDRVRWVNNDTDAHTVTSDDSFNTVGKKLAGVNEFIPPAGTFTLRFGHPGTFVYYCRFHATLDAANQPTAPGPDGGIQDPATGNFGTPMMGVITVLPGR